tara:strand:- start:466 stop:1116 length:651 start_codon:yes stop_codon:yes gene_type:complete
MKTIIDFNNIEFAKKMNAIKSLRIELTDLVESFYNMKVVAQKGIILNKLVYDENYINDLLSKKDNVKALDFKNNSELYKFYVNQNDYLLFESIRLKCAKRLSEMHIPTDYYKIDGKTGVVEIKHNIEDKIRLQFQTIINGEKESEAYEMLNDLIGRIRHFEDVSNSRIMRGSNVELRNWYTIKDGFLIPSVRGIKTLARTISLKEEKSFSAEHTVV